MDTEETATKTTGSRFKYIGLVVALLVAFGARALLIEWADPVHDDNSPGQRVPKNAPFIVTNDKVVDKMIEVAKLSEDDLVYDLGCGDGRIVITAATTSGCRGVGLEIDPEIAAQAQENVELHNVGDRVTIRVQDVFEADLREADCVVMYLLPWMTMKLIPQFQQLRPGVRIVSHNYGFGGNLDYIEPDERHEVPVEGEGIHRVYVWVTPLKVPEEKAKD